jgi:hypothetical protein
MENLAFAFNGRSPFTQKYSSIDTIQNKYVFRQTSALVTSSIDYGLFHKFCYYLFFNLFWISILAKKVINIYFFSYDSSHLIP